MDLFTKLLTCCVVMSSMTVLVEPFCITQSTYWPPGSPCLVECSGNENVGHIPEGFPCGTPYTVILHDMFDINQFKYNSLYAIQNVTAYNNVWKTIDYKLFGRFNKANVVSLSFCNITEIDDAFSDFEQITNLILSHNDMENLPRILVGKSNKNSSLTQLDLSYNRLSNLDGNAMANLANLKILDVGYNELMTISDDIGKLKSVRMFYVNNNKLTSLNTKILFDLENLEHLDVSHNFIKELSIQLTPNRVHTSLTYFDLSYNFIKTIQSGYFKMFNHIETIKLSDNNLRTVVGLEVISNKSVKLDLSRNYIVSLKIAGFTRRNIDLSNETLLQLSITDQNIETVGSDDFSGIPGLQHLNISHNKISIIDKASFTHTKALNVLDVSYNRLTDVGFFKMFSGNLQEVYLNDNLLSVLPNDTFESHIHLQKLVLSRNQLKTLGQNVVPTIFFTFLDISHNNLNYIDPCNFKGIDDMSTLDLSYNHLPRFELDSTLNIEYLYLNNNNFTSVPAIHKSGSQLTHMNLSYNIISAITDKAFNNISALRVLDLSDNEIVELSPGTFFALKKLTHLNLSSNFIETLEPGCFGGLDLVEEINLSRNRIKHINVYCFYECTGLTSLLIDYNGMIMTSEEIINLIRYSSSLETLSLGGNNIDCNDIVKSIVATAAFSFRSVRLTSLFESHDKGNVKGLECFNSWKPAESGTAKQEMLPITYLPTLQESQGSRGQTISIIVLSVLFSALCLGVVGYIVWKRRGLQSYSQLSKSRIRFRSNADSTDEQRMDVMET